MIYKLYSNLKRFCRLGVYSSTIWSMCLACVRPWVQLEALFKTHTHTHHQKSLVLSKKHLRNVFLIPDRLTVIFLP